MKIYKTIRLIALIIVSPLAIVGVILYLLIASPIALLMARDWDEFTDFIFS